MSHNNELEHSSSVSENRGSLVEENATSIHEIYDIKTWDEMELKPEILRGIYSLGFENPSAIQKKAIYPIIKQHDVIGQAQSGTGKTGTFSISALQRVDLDCKQTQVFIIVPTHELVLQIETVINNIGQFMDGLNVKTLIGGTSINDDIHTLKNNPPHIIIGCTGRIYDMIKRRALRTIDVKLCILDEADEMLSRGFSEQIYNIFQCLPSAVQIALFSATMPQPILKLTEKFMRNPYKIIMKPEELNLEGINQFYLAMINDHSKYDTLKMLFEHLTVSQTIIYVNSINRVIELNTAMNEEGFSVCCIHSNMTKEERKEVVQQFRNGEYRVLISSNLTARGLDIQQVNTVINFDIPKSAETYLHRIGRSGRWGRKGTAINFVTKHDIYHMRNIEKHYGIDIKELPENYVFN